MERKGFRFASTSQKNLLHDILVDIIDFAAASSSEIKHPEKTLDDKTPLEGETPQISLKSNKDKKDLINDEE